MEGPWKAAYSEPVPSTSKAQARLMAAACHSKTKMKVPKSVACEFHKHDKGLRYKKAHGKV